MVEATKRLDELNHEICTTAERLAGLLLKREDILAAHPLIDNEHSGPDPIYLWEALELALATPDLLPWASVASAELAPFLRIAAEQSRPGPEWADLLHQLSSRDYRRALPYEAADIAVVASGTNQTAWSPWLLRLIATLYEAKAIDGTSLLQCLTNKQLASLAEVALDTPAAVINDSQIRMLKRRFLKRNIPAND